MTQLTNPNNIKNLHAKNNQLLVDSRINEDSTTK